MCPVLWTSGSGTERYHDCMAHATKADKAAVKRRAAIERTRGMFAHLAPCESLADELIANRRAEARAEDRETAEEAQRLRGK
jgi:hypothetical protein